MAAFDVPTANPPGAEPSRGVDADSRTVSPQAPAASVALELPESQVQRVLRNKRVNREADRRLAAEESPPIPLPVFSTLSERLAQPRTDTPWRIVGWFPAQARVLLVAQAKCGKTTAIGNLCRSLVDGVPWLGCASVVNFEGTVAVLDAEMSQQQLDDWYRDQDIVNTDRVIMVALRGKLSAFNILDAKVRSEWAAGLRARRVHVLIFDCLRPVLDALGLDEQHEAGRFLVAFDALLTEAGIEEAVLVHHMGHGGERARGDSRLRDWPDVELRLYRKGDARYIAATGRDVEIGEHRLSYDAPQRRLTIADGGGTRKDAERQGALDAVVELLKSGPKSGRGVDESLAGGGFPRKAIRAALAFGVKTGALSTAPGSRNAVLYRLTAPAIGPAATPVESVKPGAHATHLTLATNASAPVRRSAP